MPGDEVLAVMPGKKVALTIGDSTGDAKMAVSDEVKFDLIHRIGLVSLSLSSVCSCLCYAYDIMRIMCISISIRLTHQDVVVDLQVQMNRCTIAPSDDFKETTR